MRHFKNFAIPMLSLMAWLPVMAQATKERVGFHGTEIPASIWTENGISYQILDDEANEVMVVDLLGKGWGKWGYTQPVTVPEYVSHDGIEYKVTRVATDTFNHSTEVSLPASIIQIESGCFNSLGYDAQDSGSQEEICFSFPSGLQGIGNKCFNSTLLNEMKFPSHLKNIGDECFCYNNSLTSIEFNRNLRSIGAGSFSHNTALKEISLPNSLALIGEDAFCNEDALEKVKLPRYLGFEYGSARLMDMKIFNECPNIKVIEWETEVPVAMPQSFNAVNKGECTLIVADGCKDKFQSDEYWKDFNIVEKSAYQASLPAVEVAAGESGEYYYTLTGFRISSKIYLEPGEIYIHVTSEGTRRILYR